MITHSPHRRRLALWGVIVVATYLGVVALSLAMGWIANRPLYDGLVPLPPYRWVAPPAERAQDNQVPQPETFPVQLRDDGSADPASVTTGDGQATLTFDLISPLKGKTFQVTMTPLDPGPPAAAPEGSYFDANAYRIEGIYEESQEPLEGSFTVVLRYSVHARQMLTLSEGAWQPLFKPLSTPIDLQVSARTASLGTFVASGKGTRPLSGSEHEDETSVPAPVRPYRWVNPPADEAGNEKPEKETVTVNVDSFGQTDVDSVSTQDGQVAATFDYVPPEGRSSFEVVIEPLDPAALGPAPKGKHFDGNAYRITAAYPDGAPIANAPSSVIFRYLGNADRILILGDSGWTELLQPTFGRSSKIISARTTSSGTYVVAATGSSSSPEAKSGTSGLRPWLLGAGALLVLAAVAVPMRRRKRTETVETDPEKI